MLRDQAHQYKEQYAPLKDNYLTTFMLRGFMKYVAPSIIVIGIVTMAFCNFFNSAHASPQGFVQQQVQRGAPQGFGIEGTQPNTIAGVMKNGHTNDYVVLEGRFITEKQDNSVVYYFADRNGSKVLVDITESNNAVAPVSDVNYYLWGTVQRSFFNTSIKAIEYTPMG